MQTAVRCLPRRRLGVPLRRFGPLALERYRPAMPERPVMTLLLLLLLLHLLVYSHSPARKSNARVTFLCRFERRSRLAEWQRRVVTLGSDGHRRGCCLRWSHALGTAGERR